MSDGTEESVVEPYVLRLLDKYSEEIRMCDSKASILFAGVAFAAALLAGQLVDDSTLLRQSGPAVVLLSVTALAALGGSMWLLGFAVVPRVANPTPGHARYFEDRSQLFETSDSLLAVVAEDAKSSVERHARNCWCSHVSHIASTATSRVAMYAVCVAVVAMAVAAPIATTQSG